MKKLARGRCKVCGELFYDLPDRECIVKLREKEL